MTDQNFLPSKNLVSLDHYFDEMIELFESGSFPKVLLLNGKKGIGKFTLVFHFLNYIYSKKEKSNYKRETKLIDVNSNFYNSILNKTCSDVIFIEAEEGKNIKIDDVRNLKSILSKSTLSNNPRFIIIDEVEFLNASSVNALLKTLEEPSKNNYFILINNQQANLIETISSRCLKNNIFLDSEQKKTIINYLVKEKNINLLFEDINLSPGQLLNYNQLFHRYKIDNKDDIFNKIKKLLYAYKKDKNKALASLAVFLIDQFFFQLIKKNVNKIDFLLKLKFMITNKINDFILYNLNINSVLNTIDLKLNNVR